MFVTIQYRILYLFFKILKIKLPKIVIYLLIYISYSTLCRGQHRFVSNNIHHQMHKWNYRL